MSQSVERPASSAGGSNIAPAPAVILPEPSVSAGPAPTNNSAYTARRWGQGGQTGSTSTHWAREREAMSAGDSNTAVTAGGGADPQVDSGAQMRPPVLLPSGEEESGRRRPRAGGAGPGNEDDRMATASGPEAALKRARLSNDSGAGQVADVAGPAARAESLDYSIDGPSPDNDGGVASGRRPRRRGDGGGRGAASNIEADAKSAGAGNGMDNDGFRRPQDPGLSPAEDLTRGPADRNAKPTEAAATVSREDEAPEVPEEAEVAGIAVLQGAAPLEGPMSGGAQSEEDGEEGVSPEADPGQPGRADSVEACGPAP